MDHGLLVVLVVICGSVHAQACKDKITGCSFIFCRFYPSVKRKCPKTCGGCPTGTTPRPTPTTTAATTPSGFNVWSACSKTCGSGSRYRVPKCKFNDVKRCPKEYADCNTNKCSSKKCSGSTQQRYGDKSQCCSNNAASPCGTHPSISQRILGGVDANLQQWPWMIRVERKSGSSSEVCGGTLIHRKWVLTAAHCVSETTRPQISAYVGYGTTNHQLKPKIQRIIQHPQFMDFGSYSVNDIALVQLTAPVSTNEHVYPVCLPRGEVTPTDKQCYILGWGSTTMNGPHVATNILQEARVRTLPFDVCANAYNSRTNDRMDENIMKCAGIIAGGVDSCVGDSGGPLLCQRCKSCDWYVSGTVSFGPNTCGLANMPGVYTNVVNFESWIRRHVPQLQSTSYSCN